MASIANPTFQKANLGLPNANTPLIQTINPSQVTQAWMMFFLQMSNAIAGNGAALEGVLQGIDDIADLRLQTTSTLSAQIVYVAGYYSEGDGGEGVFLQAPSSNTTADNGGTVIVDASGRRWLRQTGGGPFNVKWFGAQAAGLTNSFDNSGPIQAALDWCQSLGGGAVTFPVGSYLCMTPINVWGNCGLVGLCFGRPCSDYQDPVNATSGPVLLIRNSTSTAFITLVGSPTNTTNIVGASYGVGIATFYPDQVTFTASTPNVYPYTWVGYKNSYMERLNDINGYQSFRVIGGRSYVIDCVAGGMQNGLSLDDIYDYVFVTNFEVSISYEYYPPGANYLAEPIDTWILANRIGVSIARADAFKFTNLTVFGTHTGLSLIDSGQSQPSGTTCSYGTVMGADFDSCEICVLAQATNDTGGGVQLMGCNMGGVQFSIQTVTGGSEGPNILWSGGGNRSAGIGTGTTMSLGATNPGAVICRDIINFVPYGIMDAIQPAVPASATVAENFFPWTVQIYLAGSTISHVAINGQLVGASTGNVMVYTLSPGDTITVTYTGTISWEWVGI